MMDRIEYSVLSCLLNHNELVSAVEVESKHFPNVKTQTMFTAIVEAIGNAGKVDLNLLASYLSHNYGAHHWDPDLEALIDAPGPAENFAVYQQALKGQYLKFQARSIGGELNKTGDVAAALESLKGLDSTDVSSSYDKKSLGRLFIHDIDTDPDTIKTGIHKMDSKLGGLHGSDLIVIGARPSMGKTALACNIARKCYEPFVFFSGEQGASQLMQRFVAIEGGAPLWKMRNRKLSEEDYQSIASSVGTLTSDASPDFYVVDKPSPSLQDILFAARKHHHEHGIKLVVVDYLQRMRVKGPNRREGIEDAVRGLKELARELDIPVVVLAQVNRAVDSRDNKHPGMADLLESGAIEAEADQVLMLSREAVYTKDKNDDNAKVSVEKNRHGPVGMMHLKFRNEYLRFEDG